MRTARRLCSAAWAIALGLVLGGALGNLVDRIFRAPGFLRGGVVDFMSLFAPDGRVWPVFNLADSAIVCGGILGVLLALRGLEFDGTRGRGPGRRRRPDPGRLRHARRPGRSQWGRDHARPPSTAPSRCPTGSRASGSTRR